MTESLLVAAGGGAGLRLKRGEQFGIIDIEGGQTGDLVAFSADGRHRLSSGRTFDYGGRIYVSTGDVLWSDRSERMLTIDCGMRTVRYALMSAVALCLAASTAGAQNRLGGHFGVVFPIVTHANGDTTNIGDDFKAGFPMGITVKTSEKYAFDLELVPIPMKFPFRKAGWAALVVGIAATAAGTWAVTVDGDQVACAAPDRFGHCPTVRSTRALGGALIGAGAATATLGGAWIYISGGVSGVVAPAETADGRNVRGGTLLVGGQF